MYYKLMFAAVVLAVLIASPAAAETQYSAAPQATPLPAAPVLPETGGVPLLPLGAGLLLIGGGLVARRA
jgi:hypothetical protein